MKKYVIIEKDETSLNCIKESLSRFSDIEFIDVAKNQTEALSLFFKSNPDFVFLDFDNTIESIADFLLDINLHCDNKPIIIGMSLFKKNAYEAYRFDFFDFILMYVFKECAPVNFKFKLYF